MQNIHRTHSRENHGSIQECINPIELAQVMVTRDTKPQAKDENTQRKRRVASDAPRKRGSTKKMVRSMFVHKSSGWRVSLITSGTANGRLQRMALPARDVPDAWVQLRGPRQRSQSSGSC